MIADIQLYHSSDQHDIEDRSPDQYFGSTGQIYFSLHPYYYHNIDEGKIVFTKQTAFDKLNIPMDPRSIALI